MMYTVKGFSNKEHRDSDYSECFISYIDDCPIASLYTDEVKEHHTHTILFIEKAVCARTGTGAIMKLRKWQNYGLPEAYLSEEDI